MTKIQAIKIFEKFVHKVYMNDGKNIYASAKEQESLDTVCDWLMDLFEDNG